MFLISTLVLLVDLLLLLLSATLNSKFPSFLLVDFRELSSVTRS